jgi:acyl carrier protein
MDPELALAALAGVLGRDEDCVTVADVDWARFAPAFTAAHPSPLLGDLPEVRAALDVVRTPGADSGAWAGQLAGLSATERTDTVLALVREQTAAVLGHRDLSAVPETRAFKELGFDSLTAVELRDALVRITGAKLPATAVFDHPTPAEMAAVLVATLCPDDGAEVSLLTDLDRLEAALGREADNAVELRDVVAARLRAMLAAWTRPISETVAPAVTEKLGAASDDELFAFINQEFGRRGDR